jgi:hypothetical protein
MKDKKEGESAKGVGGIVPSIAENLYGPEVYADVALFFALKGGNISITFGSTRFDNSTDPGTIKRVVIGRLVMPAAGALGLADGLYEYLRQQKLLPDKAGAN